MATEKFNTFEALLASGSRQVCKALARDPMLRALDEIWNVHPSHEDLPIDWAGAARALRTVWALSLGSPVQSAQSLMDVNGQLWWRALDGYGEVALAWFAAPDRRDNPMHRALVDMHRLASNWLLRQGERADGLDEDDRELLAFHLRQFAEAMRPTPLRIPGPWRPEPDAAGP